MILIVRKPLVFLARNRQFKSSRSLNLVVYKYKFSYFKGVYVRNTLAVIKTASTKMIKTAF